MYIKFRLTGSQQPLVYGLHKIYNKDVSLRPILFMNGLAQHQLVNI